MTGWGRGKAAGPRPGAEGAEGPPLALRNQNLENHILGRPRAQSHRLGLMRWWSRWWSGSGVHHTSTAGSEPRPCRCSCSSCFILGFSVRVCHTRTCPRRATIRARSSCSQASRPLVQTGFYNSFYIQMLVAKCDVQGRGRPQ